MNKSKRLQTRISESAYEKLKELQVTLNKPEGQFIEELIENAYDKLLKDRRIQVIEKKVQELEKRLEEFKDG